MKIICEMPTFINVLFDAAFQKEKKTGHKVVIDDRTEYGDSFKKPTAFWFLNCEPNMFVPKSRKKKPHLVNETKNGIERSVISKEFAKRFLEGFVGLERK